MAADTGFWVIMVALIILLVFAFLCVLFWFGWWLSQRPQAVSPYTGIPLRRASDLSYYSIEKYLRYLHDLKQYDNRMFDYRKASYCRETGRIFQDSVTWLDTIHVDWNFLQKRYPGYYVSWGSLNHAQQEAIRNAHDTLEGFQTERSSPSPAPRAIEPEYIYAKPGPLYVNLDTKVLLGWKIVPDTELEVLIVQKPIR